MKTNPWRDYVAGRISYAEYCEILTARREAKKAQRELIFKRVEMAVFVFQIALGSITAGIIVLTFLALWSKH